MATKKKSATGPAPARDARLNIRIAKDLLDGLAAWGRTEGRTTEAQGRYLIEQAVVARVDRLAMTRR